MRYLLALALCLTLGFQSATACPASGCVEIMQQPTGEEWGYVDSTQPSERPFANATVASVESTAAGGRRITVAFEPASEPVVPEEGAVLSYMVRVKKYDATTNELISMTANETILTITASEGCPSRIVEGTGCIDHFSWTCWAFSCQYQKSCPGTGCQVYTYPCEWGYDGWDNCMCTVPLGGPICTDPRGVASYYDSCPAGTFCVVEISDGISHLS